MKVKPVIRTGLAGRPRGISKRKQNILPCFVYMNRDMLTNLTTIIGYNDIIHQYTCPETPTQRTKISPKHKSFYRIREKKEVYACQSCRLTFLTQNIKSKMNNIK